MATRSDIFTFKLCLGTKTTSNVDVIHLLVSTPEDHNELQLPVYLNNFPINL